MTKILGYVPAQGNDLGLVILQDPNNELHALHVAGKMTLVDSDGNMASISSAGGGGDNLYNNIADFQAKPTVGTKNIVITAGPQFTIEPKHVVAGRLIRITSTGAKISENFTGLTISGSTITFQGIDDFVTGDEVLLEIIGPPRAESIDQNADLSIRTNPEWNHYTSIEHIIDDADNTVDQHYSPEIFMESWRNLIIQLTGSTSGSGVVFTVWGTLNENAATPADGDANPSADWIDISTAVLGAASVTLNGGDSGFYNPSNVAMFHKIIIKYDIDNATNSTDIFIRRY